MSALEIIVIVLASLVVIAVIVSAVIRKVRHKGGGCCGCPYAGQCGGHADSKTEGTCSCCGRHEESQTAPSDDEKHEI